MHKIRIEWGGRKQVVEVKDQTVYDSEFMGDDPDAVVWGEVPNRLGHYVHLVKTRRSQVEVVEKRGANGPLSLTASGGKFSVWQPNGAILRVLRIWKRVEWLDKSQTPQPEPDPEVVIRRLDGAQKKDLPRPEIPNLQMAVESASHGVKRSPLKEFHAILQPASKGIDIVASKPGNQNFRMIQADARTALEAFKSWMRDDDVRPGQEDLSDVMPRSAILQAVRELAQGRWASTPEIVHVATGKLVNWTDARYASFAQRISSDRKEANGWYNQLLAEGIDLHEQHRRIRGPGGAMIRVKHYRYDL